MRKAQKRKILEILKSLGQAHKEIKEELARCSRSRQADTQRARNMLGECQEFAISVGKSIEDSEGEGGSQAVVAAIEAYCETLYEAYMETEKADGGISENKIYKLLKKRLTEIENRVKNDITSREEVVFLPYKAAMWDSMESVWMEARDKGNADVYVIPIPYFERDRGQGLGEMHYEGNEYPEYVPVTDWREYRIEEHRPDAIYIQNPYDDCNYVTCVHPQYFSGELKKHTDMLVYLPYFVGIDEYVGGHLCTAPGIMNADRVIVQSEAVKKIYIENIRKYERENNCRGAFGDLETKFVSSGSPKLERLKRVIESGKIEIPEDWKDKICQPDGGKKKVILYNTTVDALLKHDGTYMDKLRSVLAVFRGDQKVLLLWRPHPLLATAIKSMRSDLYAEYMEIVRTYREENWGIYDETADLDRAIVLSDAYYGDMSSVVELYKVTGKPIMIQDCETLSV